MISMSPVRAKTNATDPDGTVKSLFIASKTMNVSLLKQSDGVSNGFDRVRGKF